jgi:predicted nucleic-acid-binding Zn-ribbon protein
MKNNKVCPKCNSNSIQYADRIYSGGGFGGKEYIGLGPKSLGGMNSRFVAYVCNNCGYSELYLVKE